MFVPPPHRSLPSIKTAKERLQALAGKLKGRAITCLDKGKEWAEKGIEKGTAGLGKAAQWCAEIPSPPGLPSAKEMHIAKTAQPILKGVGFALGAGAVIAFIAVECLLWTNPIALTVCAVVAAVALTCFIAYILLDKRLETQKETITQQALDALVEGRGTLTDPKLLELLQNVDTLTLNGSELFKSDIKWTDTELLAFANTLTKNCPKLTHLNINGGSWKDDHIHRWKGCKQLKAVHLVDCHNITPRALKKLSHCPLEELSLIGCRLKPLLPNQILHNRALKDEEKRVLAAQTDPDPIKCQLAVRNHMQQYRNRIIDNVEARVRGGRYHSLNAADVSFLSAWPKLKELHISHVDDTAISNVIAKLPNLKVLVIPHSNTLTGEGFSALRQNNERKKLETIVLGQCYSWQPKGFEHLQAIDRLQQIKFTDEIIDYATTPIARAAYELHYEQLKKDFRAPDKDVAAFKCASDTAWVRRR